MARRIITVLIMVGVLMLVPLGVQAQGDVRLVSLRVGLWPEYDQPSLLVIYWGELAPEVSYPATVSLRMPARIVAPHVVAAQTAPDGNVVEAAYDAVVEGDWRIVTFEANGPLFQFEYYDALDREGQAREIAYNWAGDYAVENFSVEFQVPPGAENLSFAPSLVENRVSAQDGLLYYNGQFGSVAAGQEFAFTGSYDRSQTELTTSVLGAASGQGGTTPAVTAPVSQGGTGGVDIVLLVVVAVVFFLLGAAAMRVAINVQDLNRQAQAEAPKTQKPRKRRK